MDSISTGITNRRWSLLQIDINREIKNLLNDTDLINKFTKSDVERRLYEGFEAAEGEGAKPTKSGGHDCSATNSNLTGSAN